MKRHHASPLSLLATAWLGLAAGPTLHAALPAPDLTVDLVSPPAAAPGEDIGNRIRLIVKNVGTAPAHGTQAHPTGYMVDLTLGRDQNVPAGFRVFSANFVEDALLKGGRVSNTVDLAPGAFHQYATGAGIPADTPPGDYFVCATVDPGGAVAESNEGNNTTCRRIRIAQRVNVGPQSDFPNKFK
ncbi:MAG: hypothetical protein NEA02_13290 [Thermoanaerobaculia bacterium]|nr:hypothetical protein [Thermoanaerobaculia bacterium]